MHPTTYLGALSQSNAIPSWYLYSSQFTEVNFPNFIPLWFRLFFFILLCKTFFPYYFTFNGSGLRLTCIISSLSTVWGEKKNVLKWLQAGKIFWKDYWGGGGKYSCNTIFEDDFFLFTFFFSNKIHFSLPCLLKSLVLMTSKHIQSVINRFNDFHERPLMMKPLKF